MYGGGPVSDGIGDNLSAAGVKLRSVYGATEFGAPTHIFPTHEEDWKEWCWSEFDREACLVWEDQGDGTEELIISVSLLGRSLVGRSYGSGPSWGRGS